MSTEVIYQYQVVQRKPVPIAKMAPTRNLRNTQTPDTLALSAAVFGFAGHGLATPHAAISRLWWTQDRISRTVTPEYISSRLSLVSKSRLHKRPAFAKHSSKGCIDDACLTDDTYLEWVLTRCRRLFLALQAVGAADEIFAIVDAAWCDEDLPLAQGDICYLAGVCSKSGGKVVSSGFFAAQFEYLLRELGSGLDIDYGINEAVPVEFTGLAPAAAALEPWFRVHLARRPEKVFVQRRTKFLNSITREADLASWKAHIALQRQADHPHIASVFASYTMENGAQAVAIMDFVPEHTLRSFIEHRVTLSIDKLSQDQRLRTVLRWMYCLAGAVAYMHRNALVCPHITPSNILVAGENRIAFTEIGKSGCLQKAKTLTAAEVYCYEAPEKPRQLADSILSRTVSKSRQSSPSDKSVVKGPRRYRSFGDLRAARREIAASAAGDLATESDIPALPAMPASISQNKDHRRLPSIQNQRLSIDWIKQIPYASTPMTAWAPSMNLAIGAGPPTPPPDKDMSLSLQPIPRPSRTAPRPPKLSIWPMIRPSTPSAAQMPVTPKTPHPRPISSSVSTPPTRTLSTKRPQTPAPPSPLTMRFFTAHTSTTHQRFPPSPPRTASTTEKPLPSLPTTPASLLNPQRASDIFSLGCVYLDILSYLLGHRPYTEFVKFRRREDGVSASSSIVMARSETSLPSTGMYKTISSSRSSSTSMPHKPPKSQPHDQSFHANLPRVTAWITQLEDEIATKKSPQHLKQKSSSGNKKGLLMAGAEHDPLSILIPLLDIVRSMLSADALARPDAEVLLIRLGAVLGSSMGVGVPECCGSK